MEPAEIVMVMFLGTVVGIHVATWGAYKDSPFEGFRPGSYVRSIIVAVVLSMALLVWPAFRESTSILVVVGVVYALERLGTEWWKAIVRIDDQSAYTIPMRLGMHGMPVKSAGVRYAVGVSVLVLIGAAIAAAAFAQHLFPAVPMWVVALTVGTVGGWTTAIGGAWKDAPIEGFSLSKLLRSPAVAAAWAVPLALLTDDWVIVALAAGGMAVASIETYKTFFTGGRPPGKFAEIPVRHKMVRARRGFAMVHAALWAALAVSLLLPHIASSGDHHDVQLTDHHEVLVTAVSGIPIIAAFTLAVLIAASATRLDP